MRACDRRLGNPFERSLVCAYICCLAQNWSNLNHEDRLYLCAPSSGLSSEWSWLLVFTSSLQLCGNRVQAFLNVNIAKVVSTTFNVGVCGSTTMQDYDKWLDGVGNPIPWNSEAFYQRGEIIDVLTELTVNHWGHIELKACPMGSASTQACFDANPLTFVGDLTQGMPADPAYPERAYAAISFPLPPSRHSSCRASLVAVVLRDCQLLQSSWVQRVLCSTESLCIDWLAEFS